MNRTQPGEKRGPEASRRGAAGVEDALAAAIGHHRAGRLDDAAAIYRQLLDADPGHAEALHLLGVVAHQRGQHGAAADLIAKAVARDPNHAKAHANLGVALAAAGDLDAAVAAYRAAVALDPDHAAAHFNLGVALAHLGKRDEAVAAYRDAVAIDPGYAEAHANLGAVLKDQGKLDEAVASCRQAIARDPKLAGAHYNLGLALNAQDKLDEAIAAYREAIALAPDHAEAHSNLGVALGKHGALEDAIAAHREAIALKPEFAEAHQHLGTLHFDMGEVDDAVAAYQKVVALRPDHAEAHTVLGIALRQQGKPEDAIASYRRAIDLDRDYVRAHYSLGVALADQGKIENALAAYDRALAIDSAYPHARQSRALLKLSCGNFATGWHDYRVRSSTRHTSGDFRKDPLGYQLAGKNVLVLRDQGLGDEIFFLRFMPRLKARNAFITYSTDPRIAAMVGRLPSIDRLAGPEDRRASFDMVFFVGDLPFMLGMTDARDIPPLIELSVLPERLAEMGARLASLGPSPYIGVTWRAGNRRRGRKCLERIAPMERLAAALRPIDGTIVVVQRNPAGGEIEAFADILGRDAHDFTALNDDLEGMLALVDLLDDYVCVSNFNVQLRAARGRPSRVLVPHPPEFRWMVSGDESPWFPGTRVYRQAVDYDWDQALITLERDLAAARPRTTAPSQ